MILNPRGTKRSRLTTAYDCVTANRNARISMNWWFVNDVPDYVVTRTLENGARGALLDESSPNNGVGIWTWCDQGTCATPLWRPLSGTYQPLIGKAAGDGVVWPPSSGWGGGVWDPSITLRFPTSLSKPWDSDHRKTVHPFDFFLGRRVFSLRGKEVKNLCTDPCTPTIFYLQTGWWRNLNVFFMLDIKQPTEGLVRKQTNKILAKIYGSKEFKKNN